MIRNKRLQLHFIGIGGIGMSGIAEVLLSQGYSISGSDIADSDLVRRLRDLGARVSLGHSAEHVAQASVVVVSSAIHSDNPELLEARRRGIPVIPRAEMLAELMRGKVGIAISGTHGKTTTSSMLGTILTCAGNDPTLVIGGKVDALGGNAKNGHGELVVAEADESDGSFHHLPATYAIITNIDSDHLDHFGTIEAVEDAFVAFVAKLPFYGAAAVCVDDPRVRRCLPRFTKPVITYGLRDGSTDQDADILATEIQLHAPNSSETMGSSFLVLARRSPGEPHRALGRATIAVPGRHNVLNALGAIAIALRLDLPFDAIVRGLATFGGVRRRFEKRFHCGREHRLVIDDYAHHPTEIAATIASARAFWPGRIIAVFQPHRFTRTRDCLSEFPGAFRALTGTDRLLVTDIYPAGEAPLPGIHSEALLAKFAGTIEASAKHTPTLESAIKEIMSDFRAGDMILCMGAGSITKLAEKIATHASAALGE